MTFPVYPHRIRLRGPWECLPLDASAGSHAVTVKMPGRWQDQLGDIGGPVRLTRKFGYPGTIDDYERVWLTIAGVAGRAEVSLNGHALGILENEPGEYDVTQRLGERNRLEVVVHAPAGHGWLDEVAMEIRCRAYLRRVRAWQVPANDGIILHVAGEAVGVADQPLELYALADQATVAYDSVTPAPEGQPFSLRTEPMPPPRTPLARVDLVCGAVIWYAVEVPIGTPPGGPDAAA